VVTSDLDTLLIALYVPDRTVRGDRRPRDPARPAPPRAAEETARGRAGVPGGGGIRPPRRGSGGR